MLAYLLTGLAAWRIAKAQGHKSPWAVGAIALFVPLAGLWAAATPPEDGQEGQG